MSWARVDDGWWCHPKVLSLDLDARGLWVSALSWSCQQKTSVVPAAVVRMCGDDGSAAAKLVNAGLWLEHDGGYLIHDWDDYQSDRAKKAAAGREGGKKSGETRRTSSQVTDPIEAPERASPEAQTGASHEAGPSRPDPSLPDQTKSEARKRAERATRLPDGWQPEPEPELVKAIGGQRAAREQFDRFCDHWRGQPGAKGRKVDWQATWRNWLRRAPEFSGGKLQVAKGSPETEQSKVYGTPEYEARQAVERAQREALVGGA
ncbi:MAG: hypothetical protein LC679_07570 [Intrasporangiaceae bacterium]|nr:hypothetical protein [Intrasporangiaceae bacterium]